MSSTPAAVDVAMKDGGYYSLATRGAKDVIDAATPLVLDTLQRMRPAATSRPFLVTDMGCADGGTSLAMMRRLVTRVRELAPARDISVLYTDLPRNDYNALLRTAHGLAGEPGVADACERVYVSASATSFYRQIVPAGTLDLGFSATAMHWLSAKPCDITDHVQAVGAKGAELAAFRAQGLADWQTILLARAAELASGGALVMVNFCRDEQGRHLGNTGGVSMFETFRAVWRDLLSQGVIDDAEYHGMTLPQYYKDVPEFSAPLLDEAGPVHAAGLRLEHVETRVVRCPFAAAFEQHGDADRFAREYVPTLRSWTESTFAGALSSRRPEAERKAVIERYYRAYEDVVRASPAGHGMDYVHAYLVIRKV